MLNHLETADADGAGGAEDGDPLGQANLLYLPPKTEQAPVIRRSLSRFSILRIQSISSRRE
jgi:hypothetical protein